MEMDSLVGFRFKPTIEEIICLLKEKRLNPDFSVHTVKEIDFYRFDPWELPSYSEIQSKESIWYFYCKPHNFKNSNNNKERKTKSGTWKITGNGSPVKAKNTKVVIGRKKILSFQRCGAISKKAKAKKAKAGAIVKKAKAGAIVKKAKAKKARAEWVMHEIHVEDDPLYKEDVVVCRLEHKRDSKCRISTSDDNELSHLEFAEDSSPKFVLQPNQQFEDQPPSKYLTSDYSNHAAEKIFSGFEDQPPSQYLTSDYRNHAAEKTLPTVECQQLPSHYFNSTSDYINHSAENMFQMDKFQQLTSHHLTSDFRGQVAEHSFPGGESMLCTQFDALQGSNGLTYNSFPARQSPIDVEEDGFSGWNGLDHSSFPSQQCPINPEQQTSSYFDGSSDCNVLDFQFDNQHLDLISQWAFQDKSPLEETEHTLSPCFHSSKSVTEFHFDGSSFTNTETFNVSVNGYSPIASGDDYFGSIW